MVLHPGRAMCAVASSPCLMYAAQPHRITLRTILGSHSAQSDVGASLANPLERPSQERSVSPMSVDAGNAPSNGLFFVMCNE